MKTEIRIEVTRTEAEEIRKQVFAITKLAFSQGKSEGLTCDISTWTRAGSDDSPVEYSTVSIYCCGWDIYTGEVYGMGYVPTDIVPYYKIEAIKAGYKAGLEMGRLEGIKRHGEVGQLYRRQGARFAKI